MVDIRASRRRHFQIIFVWSSFNYSHGYRWLWFLIEGHWERMISHLITPSAWLSLSNHSRITGISSEVHCFCSLTALLLYWMPKISLYLSKSFAFYYFVRNFVIPSISIFSMLPQRFRLYQLKLLNKQYDVKINMPPISVSIAILLLLAVSRKYQTQTQTQTMFIQPK